MLLLGSVACGLKEGSRGAGDLALALSFLWVVVAQPMGCGPEGDSHQGDGYFFVATQGGQG